MIRRSTIRGSTMGRSGVGIRHRIVVIVVALGANLSLNRRRRGGHGVWAGRFHWSSLRGPVGILLHRSLGRAIGILDGGLGRTI